MYVCMCICIGIDTASFFTTCVKQNLFFLCAIDVSGHGQSRVGSRSDECFLGGFVSLCILSCEASDYYEAL